MLRRYGGFLCALIFIAIGAFALVQEIIIDKNCNVPVEAVCVAYSQKGDAASSSSFYPVMQYSYDGQSYEQPASLGSIDKPYEIGDSVSILIDADSPDQFRIKGDLSMKLLGFVEVLVGALFAVVQVLKNKGVIKASFFRKN